MSDDIYSCPKCKAKERAAEIKRCNKRMDTRALKIMGVLLLCVCMYKVYIIMFPPLG